MQDFRGGVYVESESFSNQLEFWMKSLICDSTKKTYSGAVKLFFKSVIKEPKDLTQDDFIKYRQIIL